MNDTVTLLGPDALRDMRKKILAGYDPTDEEVGQVLATLRAERAKIGTSSGKKSTGRSRQPLDLGSLFDTKEEKK